MASNRFKLGKCLYKSIDGKGKVYSAFNSPASQVLASRSGNGNMTETGLYMGYYTAKLAGIFSAMGFEPTGNDEDDMLAFFTKYTFDIEDLGDDGKPLGEDKDENPTTAS